MGTAPRVSTILRAFSASTDRLHSTSPATCSRARRVSASLARLSTPLSQTPHALHSTLLHTADLRVPAASAGSQGGARAAAAAAAARARAKRKPKSESKSREESASAATSRAEATERPSSASSPSVTTPGSSPSTRQKPLPWSSVAESAASSDAAYSLHTNSAQLR
eukprot:2554327-Rhodomonas_salina.2